jgi:hypothetical protein
MLFFHNAEEKRQFELLTTRLVYHPSSPALLPTLPSSVSPSMCRRSGNSRRVVERFKGTLVRPGLLGGVETVVGGRFCLCLAEEGVAVEGGVPGEGPGRDEGESGGGRVRGSGAGERRLRVGQGRGDGGSREECSGAGARAVRVGEEGIKGGVGLEGERSECERRGESRQTVSTGSFKR